MGEVVGVGRVSVMEGGVVGRGEEEGVEEREEVGGEMVGGVGEGRGWFEGGGLGRGGMCG